MPGHPFTHSADLPRAWREGHGHDRQPESIETRRIAVRVEHAPSLDAMVSAVAAELEAGDIVITMGAGYIWKAGEMLLERLGSNG